MAKRGLLIVFSGPSGVGKSTVRKSFFAKQDLQLVYSISMTTRLPREGERHGVDYFFVTKEQFMKSVERNELLEWAEFVGNLYGTPFDYVNKLRDEGKNVLLEIEVKGAEQVVHRVPDAVTIFLVPPSMAELEKRIRGRRSEDEHIIQQRLLKANYEMQLQRQYRHVVVNKNIEETAEEIANIIRTYISKNNS